MTKNGQNLRFWVKARQGPTARGPRPAQNGPGGVNKGPQISPYLRINGCGARSGPDLAQIGSRRAQISQNR